MSLDPVLKRHYINVPKPQSRLIPGSNTPPRSQTLSSPSISSYTRSDLLSLSLSTSPLTAHHAPPLPATASRVDEVSRILDSPSVEKIEKVNTILRKNSVEFLEGLVKQGKLDPSTPITAIPPPLTPKEEVPGVVRSRTVPMPVPAPVVVKRRDTFLPSSNHSEQVHSQSQSKRVEEVGQGWGEFDSMVVEDGTFGENNGKTKEHQGALLDFEIDSTLSPIDIELMSAKRLPSSSPITIPIPQTTRPGGGAGSIFNKSLGSATGHGQYSPASPSPLSLSLAQSISKRHEGLRNLISTSPSSGVGKAQPSPVPQTARSPNVQSVTIVSSPIEDLLPWRKASLISATARPIPIAPTPPVNSAPPIKSIPAVRKTIGSLNAFAPPFPLPQTTPSSFSRNRAPAIPAKAESITLPLPPSLPKKPTTILPPVFVKRELAMLPQTMALPDIPPMGEDWVGERSLSGNEKRRRASEFPSSVTSHGWGVSPGAGLGLHVGLENLSRPGSSLSMTRSIGGLSIAGGGAGGSAPNSGRPQRLVSLGEKLKENINRAV